MTDELRSIQPAHGRDTADMPEVGKLVGAVGIAQTVNWDKSVTLSLSWRVIGTDGESVRKRKKLHRTLPRARRGELRVAMKAAKAEASELEAELRGARKARESRIVKMPLVHAVAAYCDYAFCRLDRSTYNRQEALLCRFGKWIEANRPQAKTVVSLICAHIEDWITDLCREKEYKASSLNVMLSDLGRFLDFCQRRGWCRQNEARKVERLQTSRQCKDVMSDDLVRSILAVAEKKGANLHLRAVVSLETGLRAGELSGLAWSDYYPDDLEIRVRPGRETTKKHQRILPVGPLLAAVLKDLQVDKGAEMMFERNYRTFARMLFEFQHAGGANITPHDCRRWYATALAKAGCSEWWVRTLIGHKHPGNLRWYVGTPDDGKARPFVESIDRFLLG